MSTPPVWGIGAPVRRKHHHAQLGRDSSQRLQNIPLVGTATVPEQHHRVRLRVHAAVDIQQLARRVVSDPAIDVESHIEPPRLRWRPQGLIPAGPLGWC